MRIPGPSTNDSGSIPAIRKRGYSSILYAVLHAIVHFGTLGVVEAIQGAHEVAGDTADTLKVGAAIILVTHDAREAEALSCRVIDFSELNK